MQVLLVKSVLLSFLSVVVNLTSPLLSVVDHIPIYPWPLNSLMYHQFPDMPRYLLIVYPINTRSEIPTHGCFHLHRCPWNPTFSLGMFSKQYSAGYIYISHCIPNISPLHPRLSSIWAMIAMKNTPIPSHYTSLLIGFPTMGHNNPRSSK